MWGAEQVGCARHPSLPSPGTLSSPHPHDLGPVCVEAQRPGLVLASRRTLFHTSLFLLSSVVLRAGWRKQSRRVTDRSWASGHSPTPGCMRAWVGGPVVAGPGPGMGVGSGRLCVVGAGLAGLEEALMDPSLCMAVWSLMEDRVGERRSETSEGRGLWVGGPFRDHGLGYTACGSLGRG